jgi:hypothetical protein
MDIQLDVDIHGSYPPSTSSWMWSVLSMDIQLDVHPLPSLNFPTNSPLRLWHFPLLSVESWGPPPSNIWPPYTAIGPVAWEESLKVERPGPRASDSCFPSLIPKIIAG